MALAPLLLLRDGVGLLLLLLALRFVSLGGIVRGFLRLLLLLLRVEFRGNVARFAFGIVRQFRKGIAVSHQHAIGILVALAPAVR